MKTFQHIAYDIIMSFTDNKLLTTACKKMDWINYRATKRFYNNVRQALLDNGHSTPTYTQLNLVYDEMEKIRDNCETFVLAGVVNVPTDTDTIEIDKTEYHRLVALAKCATTYLILTDCPACSKPRIKAAQACPHCKDPSSRYTIFN